MSLLLWLSLALAAPTCTLAAPADAPFEVEAPEDASHVQVVIELWVRAGDEAWIGPVGVVPDLLGYAPDVATNGLEVLEARQLRGAVLFPVPSATGTDPSVLAMAARAGQAGHSVGVVFNEGQVPRDAQASPRPMKKRLKPLRQAAGGVKVVATPLPTRGAEALMGSSGFRTILQEKGPATAIPRPAVVFEGQPRIGAVLQAGPYAGPCGTRPVADPLTPRSADRATQAIWGSARLDGVPVQRVVIPTGIDVGEDSTVLARWLDEVLLPAQIRPTTPDAARQAALAYFRTGKVMNTNRLEGGGGRLVSVDEVRAAAEALADQNLLPRTLPGDLSLTEAFLAFALLLAEQNEGEVIRLTALEGPQGRTSATVEGIVELDGEAVKALARALLAELPTAVPSAMPVGDRTLSAPELLTALASTIRGTPQTWPTASPDPNAPGQGWGTATLP